MTAVDTNILVYAHRADAEFHVVAAEALQRLAESCELWAIPWPCVHEFLSVSTNPRIFEQPTPIDKAVEQIEIWRESPGLRFIAESTVYWQELAPILTRGKISGARVHDARVAAICRSHGVRELWSADRDFGRMGAIRIVNPLIAEPRPKQ